MSDPENTDPNIDPSVINLSETDLEHDDLGDTELGEPELGDSELGDTELNSADMARLHTLLVDPTLWTEPDPDLEDLIVQDITSEASTKTTSTATTRETASHALDHETNVVDISSRSRFTRSAIPFAAGIAAGLLLAVSALALRAQDNGVELALAGTDLAPQASAAAVIDQGPLGVRIKLDVTGLPPSPAGTYYEAWVRQGPEVGVSAGTFHLRGGDGEIELWAGVSTDDYPLITVTLQHEGEGTESSGKVVLKGRLE